MLTKSADHTVKFIPGLRGGEGTVEMMPLSAEVPASVGMCSQIRLRPGVTIGEHTHIGDSEIVYILEGSAECIDDGVRKELSAGDCMMTADGHSHSIMNTSDKDLVFAAIVIKS